MEVREPKKNGLSAAAWVILVLCAGIAAGTALAALPAPPGPRPGPYPRAMFDDVATVLSAVGIALLIALLVVYAKTYRETRSKFALGLLVVLAALLGQSLVSSPILFRALDHFGGPLAPLVLAAEMLKAAAFAVFLYLSLE